MGKEVKTVQTRLSWLPRSNPVALGIVGCIVCWRMRSTFNIQTCLGDGCLS